MRRAGIFPPENPNRRNVPKESRRVKCIFVYHHGNYRRRTDKGYAASSHHDRKKIPIPQIPVPSADPGADDQI
jgi:hypothetical protein